MFYLNLKLALRNLVKNRLYTLLTIIGFTLGFTIFFLILVYIIQEKTVDFSYKNHTNVFRLIDGGAKCNLNYEFSSYLKGNFPEIVNSCPVNLINGFDGKISSGERVASLNGFISTNKDFFEIFPLKPITRNSVEIFTDINSVILTKSIAKTLFPDSDPLGKEINILGTMNVTVSAVVEDFPANSSINASVFVNIENEKFRFSRSCHNNNCIYLANHFLELKKGTDSKKLSLKLNNHASTFPSSVINFTLQNLTDIYLSGKIDGNRNRQGNRSLVNVMIAIAVLILILSIINHLNFNLSLQLSRLKSIHLRKIFGANILNLAAYIFIEVSLSIILSLLLAYEFSEILLPFIDRLTGISLNINLLYSPLFLIMAGIISFTIILNLIIVPLYFMARLSLKCSTKPDDIPATSLPQNLLTIFQITVSVCLIISILVMSRQIYYVKNADVGFSMENLIMLNFPGNFTHHQAFKQKLNQFAFVESSSLSSGAWSSMNFILDEGTDFKLREIKVDSDFINTLGIKIIKGRSFLSGEKEKTFIFNETAYKEIERNDKEHIQFQGNDVIGVTRDFHISSFHSVIEPVGILLSDDSRDKMIIRLTSGDYNDKLKKINQLWTEFIPDEPFNYVLFKSWFDNLYINEVKLINLISLFGFISLFITCLGIFGQIYYKSICRTKEIGIRKINGATAIEIVMLLNQDIIRWVIAGFLLALPIAWFTMHKWLENFAYKTIIEWWIFSLAGLLALIITMLTVSWQSWRAARRNPVEALRYE